MSEETLTLARQLIREVSVSPRDGNCQQILADYLIGLGFSIEHMPFGEVSNLWAVKKGSTEGPLFAFAGHTDVVPVGKESDWQQDPFTAEVEGDWLHGRGAADMKGSLASMLTACRQFIETCPDHRGSIAFLITSDEEDVAVDGTVRVMDELEARGTKLDYCLIGEPSSREKLGDVVRVGRRGSLNGKLTVRGIQGHVAYPEQVRNPIHELGPVLAELASEVWDEGNEFFPPTSFQVSNIHGGTGANNVVPGEVIVDFNFRFSTESNEESLCEATESILSAHLTDYETEWKLSGPPFLTTGGTLIPAVEHAIRETTGLSTELSTSGGTSDGRFIAPRGIEVVELGPLNETIHKVDERVSITDLDQLSDIYEAILTRILGNES